MARYFFDVEKDGGLFVDSEGTELPDDRGARLEATQALAELALDSIPGSDGTHLRMIVRDEGGRMPFVLELTFSIAAKIAYRD